MPNFEVTSPSGQVYDVTAPAGASESDAIAYVQQQLAPGKLESAARGFVNNLPAGGQLGALGTALLKSEDDSTGMADWNQAAQEAKATNPVSYGVGAVGGALAPLAIPAVGEALATAPVATGAALGAANAVGNTDITQNPGEALKQGLGGAVVGGATAGLAGRLMPAAETFENAASRKAVQTVPFRAGLFKNSTQDEITNLGQKMRYVWDVVNGSTPEKLEKAETYLSEYGSQIGEGRAAATPVGDITAYLNPLHDKLDAADAFVARGGETIPAGGALSDTAKQAEIYRTGIKELQSAGTDIEGLQKIKESFADKAFNDVHEVNPSKAVADAAADVWSTARDIMKAHIEQQEPGYGEAMANYSQLSDVKWALEKQLDAETRGSGGPGGFGILGAIRRMPAPMRAIIGPIGLMTGHPIVGVGAALPELTSSVTHTNVLGAVANQLEPATRGLQLASTDAVSSYLLNTLTTNPKKLGRYAQPLMQAAQKGGSDGLAALHFIFSLQYSDYNQMMLEQGSPHD